LDARVTALSATAVPRIAARARLQWDEVRKRHVLLYPEGLAALSDTAAKVVRLCDGGHTLAQIVQALTRDYRGEGIAQDVAALVEGLGAKGLLTW
jgi:pyrroloquinoline quinone biosynthesis protein D